MNHSRLRRMLFLALCCDFGFFAKQLISPLTNFITDAMQIPDGIGSGFSLMFVSVAAAMIPRFGCATLMSVVQSLLAIALGRTGRMGALSPVGYIVPGLVIDLMLRLTKFLPPIYRLALTNAAACVCAALTANAIVFRLPGGPLGLYLTVSAISGALCGLLGAKIIPLVSRAVSFKTSREDLTP